LDSSQYDPLAKDGEATDPCHVMSSSEDDNAAGEEDGGSYKSGENDGCIERVNQRKPENNVNSEAGSSGSGPGSGSGTGENQNPHSPAIGGIGGGNFP
jgi:hypothetical protein